MDEMTPNMVRSFEPDGATDEVGDPLLDDPLESVVPPLCPSDTVVISPWAGEGEVVMDLWRLRKKFLMPPEEEALSLDVDEREGVLSVEIRGM